MGFTLQEAIYRISKQQNLTELALRLLGKQALILCRWDVITAPVIAAACTDEGVRSESLGLQLTKEMDADDLLVTLEYIIANVPHVFLAGDQYTRDEFSQLIQRIEDTSGQSVQQVRSHADVLYALDPHRYLTSPV